MNGVNCEVRERFDRLCPPKNQTMLQKLKSALQTTIKRISFELS